MKKNILSCVALLATIVCTACAAPYNVREVTDKFSDPNAPAVVATQGNNIDHRDPLGAVRSSEMNGVVAIDRKTGKAIYAGFSYMRRSDEMAASFSGGPRRWLTVRAGDELIALADGERVVLKAIGGSTDHKVSQGVGYSISTDYYDFAEYRGTPEQFKKIAFARSLEIKLTGLNGAEMYPRNGKPFLESFQKNLQQFYTEQIAPKL